MAITEGAPASAGVPTPRVNIAAEAAHTLALSPRDWVSRRDLRAALPVGRIRPRPGGIGKHDLISSRLRDALREFERAGWIQRDEVAVRVLDRGSLYEFAQQATRV